MDQSKQFWCKIEYMFHVSNMVLLIRVRDFNPIQDGGAKKASLPVFSL